MVNVTIYSIHGSYVTLYIYIYTGYEKRDIVHQKGGR